MLKRGIVAISRPVYKRVFEARLWWFLSKVKAYFFLEVGQQLADIGTQLHALEHRQAQVEERLKTIEANNAAQWDALEQLLLAMFRQGSASNDRSDFWQNADNQSMIPSQEPSYRTHAASSLR